MPRPPLDGFVEPRFGGVREVLEDVVAASPGTGSAVAVWHDGHWVVDLWGGYADTARTQPWTRDSLVMPYSVSKPFAAATVLVLVDRGSLGLDDPVSSYWPGFPGPATLRHLLAHQAGVVVLDEDLPTEALYDAERIRRAVERQQPVWPPGTAHGETALLYGHLLGEIVRRVDGRSLGRFLAEEVCGPAGLDFHVGLGEADLARVVDLTGYDEEFRRGFEQYGDLFHRALGNPPGVLDPTVVNSTRWRRAEVAAVNGHGTARAVAGLFVALATGGLLSDELTAEATRAQTSGVDVVLGREASWGLGVGVDEDGFGMGGVGGSHGWWSSDGGYASAFLTGHIADHARGDRVENAVREVLGLPAV